MPETAIVRAAQALYERFPRGQLVTDSAGRQTFTGTLWADLSPASRVRWIDDARAVLTAIREPSEAMVQAGERECAFTQARPDAVWEEMIDAALAEGE